MKNKNTINDLKSSSNDREELAHLLKTSNFKHPALARLSSELRANSKVNVISGYDRMHHRHNRS